MIRRRGATGAWSANRLDVTDAAAVPLRADFGAARRGEALEQARHRAGGTVCGDQLVAPEGGFPVALAASDEDGLVQLVDQPIERALDRLLAAAAPPRMEISAARVHDWISGT